MGMRGLIGMKELIERYEKFKESLNIHEIAYLEKKYLKGRGNRKSYKDFDIWLFNLWSNKNEEDCVLLVCKKCHIELHESR